MFRAHLAVTGILLAGLASNASAAAAAQIPRADLRVGHDQQQGSFVWGEWTEASGDGCVGISADGPGNYPSALRLPPGNHAARFVLHSPVEPSLVEATSYRYPRAERPPSST